MRQPVKIGTRDSQLAVWQATHVQNLLKEWGVSSELVLIKSDGDLDTITPLYEIGVQGIFTRTLDVALLTKGIDIAVHSMKDVPTIPAQGIVQAAVLKRASFRDLLVYKGSLDFMNDSKSHATIATSSIRRKAQWLYRFPNHQITNLRGNVNTRLKKVNESKWDGAIFASAGLERIGLRPEDSVDLDWMLPAPAQGAIVVVCREDDTHILDCCSNINDPCTALCTKLERDFLRTLLGGCSTPISALAEEMSGKIFFRGNVCSADGTELAEVESLYDKKRLDAGIIAAEELLQNETARDLIYTIRNEQKQD